MEDKEIHELIKSKGNTYKIKSNEWFFKTGKGEYGEGDKFLGIIVPECRKLAKELKDVPDSQVEMLLGSEYHEERLIALLILVHNYEIAKKSKNEKECGRIYKYYLAHTERINNWDLVDLSCYHIVGDYLLDKDRKILYKLAKSKLIWERRISIISTYTFIVKGEYEDTFAISDMLLHDEHDLIQKAVGWMLREVGKRVSMDNLKDFLKTRYMVMPRTMLRYSIEKFPDVERRRYIEGKV